MSKIDDLLSDRERIVLQAYRNPRAAFKRTLRLSIQYAIGMAVFVYMAIASDPRWSLAVYGIFVAWVIVRLLNSCSVAGVMPGIIEKYERRIQELESAVS